jgi:hypothetical protein
VYRDVRFSSMRSPTELLAHSRQDASDSHAEGL